MIWRATLRRGRVPRAGGRDRSASLQYRQLVATEGRLRAAQGDFAGRARENDSGNGP